jgi:hypothetical protein
MSDAGPRLCDGDGDTMDCLSFVELCPMERQAPEPREGVDGDPESSGHECLDSGGGGARPDRSKEKSCLIMLDVLPAIAKTRPNRGTDEAGSQTEKKHPSCVPGCCQDPMLHASLACSAPNPETPLGKTPTPSKNAVHKPYNHHHSSVQNLSHRRTPESPRALARSDLQEAVVAACPRPLEAAEEASGSQQEDSGAA